MRDEVLRQTFQSAWDTGKRQYLIPYGGSNPVGAAAYAEAVHELAGQNIHPDWVVFPSSSGGTQAGMVVGARHEGLDTRFLGISVDEPADVLKARVAGLANETADRLGYPERFIPGEILVNADYIGGGYGVLSDVEREAVKLFARLEGILLDPVYTGRAAGGMIDLIHKGFFKPGEQVLFWHTGGTPAMFADQYRNIL
jgi:1-aminocyclopropane-1-carboxylate deaminase/D-cysteine desulfhydrase-like pyridoxal-dependent ACC family enzyme